MRNVFFRLVDNENPFAFSLCLVQMHLYAFIAILVPKLVLMVMPLCSLCTGCHRWIPLYHKPYPKTRLCINIMQLWPLLPATLQHCAQRNALVFKLLRGRFWGFSPRRGDSCTDGGEIWHGAGQQNTKLYMHVSLTTEVMVIFVIFWPILATISLPWQRPLDPCNQKCLLWIGWPRKPPVISNRILVISRRNAFICIFSNFAPNGCYGNTSLSLVYGSVTDEFPDGTNPISKPNSAWTCCLQPKLW